MGRSSSVFGVPWTDGRLHIARNQPFTAFHSIDMLFRFIKPACFEEGVDLIECITAYWNVNYTVSTTVFSLVDTLVGE
jgi:hypothetical protein